MRRLLFALLIVVTASGIFVSRVHAGNGNGAPSGPHYNLNIHGYSGSPPTVAGGGGNGHDIWLPLKSAPNGDTSGPMCDILLQQGPDLKDNIPFVDNFQVVYPTCNNPLGNAVFQLPCPVTTTNCSALVSGSYTLTYTVYVRYVGNPNTQPPTLDTCFTDTTGTYCNTGIVTVTRKTFQNVSSSLLFICQNGANSPIFSNKNGTYWWDYDNYGTRLTQMRFYPNTNGQTVPVAC